MARWNSLNGLKLKSTARKADSGGEKRSQTEVIGSQFVLEFVNAALHSSSAIVIAPDFQRRVAAIGDKDPEHITRQVDELATYGRLGRLELLAHNDKVPRAFPIPEFEAKLTDRIDSVDGLPLSDLIKPALEISRPGAPRQCKAKRALPETGESYRHRNPNRLVHSVHGVCHQSTADDGLIGQVA